MFSKKSNSMATCSVCGKERKVGQTGICFGCQLVAKENEKAKRNAAEAERGEEYDRKVSSLPVTTETYVDGVKERLGIVTGQCALGMNIFRDFTAEIRDVVGGRSGAYQKAITEAKNIVIAEMQQEAYEMGADAVIAVDIDMLDITGGGGLFGGKGMIAMLATGTAVTFEEVETLGRDKPR